MQRRLIRRRAAIVALVSILILPGACQRPAARAGTASSTKTSAEVKRITFVELGSVNCIPCKAMQPIMERLRQEYANEVEVVFHDVWTSPGKPYADSFRIRVIPTQVFLDREGKEYYRHEGYLPFDDVLAALQRGGLDR
jgi:thioredoxin 1